MHISNNFWNDNGFNPNLRAIRAYPDKGSGEPALVVVDGAVPPVTVGGVEHLDKILGPECELLYIHGDVVP